MYDLVKVHLQSGEIPIEKVIYFNGGVEECTFYPTLHRGTLCDTIIFGDDYGYLAFRVRGKKLQLYRCNARVVEIVRNGHNDIEVMTRLDWVEMR